MAYAVGSNIARKPKAKCKSSKSINCKDNRSANVGNEPSYAADGKLKGSIKGLGSL